jgi:hypothetical protein
VLRRSFARTALLLSACGGVRSQPLTSSPHSTSASSVRVEPVATSPPTAHETCYGAAGDKGAEAARLETRALEATSRDEAAKSTTKWLDAIPALYASISSSKKARDACDVVMKEIAGKLRQRWCSAPPKKKPSKLACACGDPLCANDSGEPCDDDDSFPHCDVLTRIVDEK